tara:strand:+ start:152 stop:1036 length:885 start_codon:yes stop_codon:yes gene_type:complete
MPIKQIKETVEVKMLTTDADGNAFVQKRINLLEGQSHRLLQTDIFVDSFLNGAFARLPVEVVISPYPVIPTEMPINSIFPSAGRYPSGGDDSVLFKAVGFATNDEGIDFEQFPSVQIAASQFTTFYSDHMYISFHLIGDAERTYYDLGLSFLFTVEDTSVSNLTSSMGKLAENHDAMCAQLMSNGHMISKANLKGNVFPMWRFGGIRPEHTISPEAAGSFFLQMPSIDEEYMISAAGIRSAVADARQMGAYDAPFGARFPEWVRFNLNEGLSAGPVRDQWPPIKHADNGNVLCL